MTIVSNVSAATSALRLSNAASWIAMTVPPSSGELHRDPRQERLRAHRADAPTWRPCGMVISDHGKPLHEFALEGERARCGPRGNAELREDVLKMPGDGVLADHERPGDLLVALTGRDEAEDLELAGGQPIIVPAGSQERVHQGKVGHRPQRLIGLPRSGKLHRECVFVAERPAGLPDERASACSLVRCLELMPGMSCLTKAHERRSGIAGRKLDCPASVGLHGPKHLALVFPSAAGKLAAGVACFVDVARCEPDLDSGGQQPRPPK